MAPLRQSIYLLLHDPPEPLCLIWEDLQCSSHAISLGPEAKTEERNSANPCHAVRVRTSCGFKLETLGWLVNVA